MERESVAILISVISGLISVFALGWNVYRDVVLKARVRTSFQVVHLVVPGQSGSPQQYLDVSAVNFGPGPVTCSIVIVKISSLWKRLCRDVTHAVVLNPVERLSAKLPKTIGIGERITLLFPYEKDCVLSRAPTHVGIQDTFGRTHWAPKRDTKRAIDLYVKDFGDEPSSG